MQVIDPGHKYCLLTLDGDFEQTLTFVKRCDLAHPEKYPGNFDAYAGTTLQSVLRACCERVRYLQNQIPCWNNTLILRLLQISIWLLERRAAKRHKRPYAHGLTYAEKQAMCPKCGHTGDHYHEP